MADAKPALAEIPTAKPIAETSGAEISLEELRVEHFGELRPGETRKEKGLRPTHARKDAYKHRAVLALKKWAPDAKVTREAYRAALADLDKITMKG